MFGGANSPSGVAESELVASDGRAEHLVLLARREAKYWGVGEGTGESKNA